MHNNAVGCAVVFSGLLVCIAASHRRLRTSSESTEFAVESSRWSNRRVISTDSRNIHILLRGTFFSYFEGYYKLRYRDDISEFHCLDTEYPRRREYHLFDISFFPLDRVRLH